MAILLVSLLYIGILFAIAYYGDQRADHGRSLINNPYVYALSLAVYCTAWTFYGSVGRAASTGIGFLPIYLGPTLTALLWWFVLRKIIRISKANRITSIADFIAARYGKSTLLGALVTLVAVMGVVPYIALQLKAVASSFDLLWNFPALTSNANLDTGFWVALLLAAFAILFGTRHLDVTEHHEGLVAAIAFESVIKLLAFLAAGVVITFGLYGGLGDLFARAQQLPTWPTLIGVGAAASPYADWAWLTLLSMLAILFLPRQFQVAVVENMHEAHLNKAIWLFPLYLLVINLFVLPIAVAGLLHFPTGTVSADTFVLSVPLAEGYSNLALLIFLGGFSAATGMVIMETVALSTMISNDLVMPILLGARLVRVAERGDLGGVLLAIRRLAIVALLLLGYAYYRATDEARSLVSIGLISFAAVAQFAPAMLGGIYWKGGNFRGALAGLIGGFVLWGYTLSLPSLVDAGWLSQSFIDHGPFGYALLKPYALLGVAGLDPVSHSLAWSLFVNAGLYVVVSLLTTQSPLEHSQAARFVDVFQQPAGDDPLPLWRGSVTVQTLHDLLERFLGRERAERSLAVYGRRHGAPIQLSAQADAELVQNVEKSLAGAIGAASARVAVASVTKEERLGLEEVLRMLDETSQAIAYSRQLEQRSHQLEQKSLELEAATSELRAANDRLQELDRMKDDFISTVTHELRTPLTAIRAFTEILHDTPDLEESKRSRFLELTLRESERLTRLINQVLDLAKLEADAAEWHTEAVDLRRLIDEAADAMSQVCREQNIQLELDLPDHVPTLPADYDRLMQVVINLLSNAIKFCDSEAGRVQVRLRHFAHLFQIDVRDNGAGISLAAQQVIFDKFRQVHDPVNGKPKGTGLGLPICRQIVAHYGGELWVESRPSQGATFSFTLPITQQANTDPVSVAEYI